MYGPLANDSRRQAIECTTERSHLANLLLSKFGAVQDLNKEIQDLKNKSIIPKTIGACSAAQDSCTNNFCGCRSARAFFAACVCACVCACVFACAQESSVRPRMRECLPIWLSYDTVGGLQQRLLQAMPSSESNASVSVQRGRKGCCRSYHLHRHYLHSPGLCAVQR